MFWLAALAVCFSTSTLSPGSRSANTSPILNYGAYGAFPQQDVSTPRLLWDCGSLALVKACAWLGRTVPSYPGPPCSVLFRAVKGVPKFYQ
ncbi:hypothetical protein [Desulfovibrio sp. MES5]|uniref:hypothetical protein n=1 Tax=Desulfovibrio sp. MES5 TaxID=1899016 RepID=UPI0025C0C22F|nr:hypothetical protein [Desulfovibrio sp. MES5]